MDWGAEGLLEGLGEAERVARCRLLDDLYAKGVPHEELRRAVREDRLVLLPIELALMSAPTYTLAELSELSGVPAESLIMFWRVLGLTLDESDSARFTQEDVEAARRTRMYIEAGMPPEELLAVVRVMSTGLARTAEASRALFARWGLQGADTEADLAQRFVEGTEAMVPEMVKDLEYMLRVHLREYARHDAIGLAEVGSGRMPDTQEVAIGFADVVGFTALGESLPEVELGGIADRLADLTLEHVRSPVRLVKTIGDAVMLVSSQPEPLVGLLLDLVDAAEADEQMPPLRAGATWGHAYPRLGDWYGGTVNLASRVAGRARPGSVLVTSPLKDRLGDGFDCSRAGQKKLKNVGDPVPVHRVRRSGA